MRAQAVALAITMLVLGAIQCLAVCVAQDCNSALPPCHQQRHQASNACAQDFQLGDRTNIASPAALGVVELVRDATPRIVLPEIPAWAAPSPPRSPLVSSTILRI
jgi:hypothetical protein